MQVDGTAVEATDARQSLMAPQPGFTPKPWCFADQQGCMSLGGHNKNLKNLNLYWLAATGVAVWFLFVHTPPVLAKRKAFQDPLVLWHVAGAGGVYLACVHNSLITPSLFNGNVRSLHIWIGRVGMILGVVGFLSGFYLSWIRDGTERTFAIFVSLGGVGQMYAQWGGWHYIRLYQQVSAELDALNQSDSSSTRDSEHISELVAKKNEYLKYHIAYMLALFVGACTIPAIMRITDGFDSVWPLLVAIGGVNMVITLYTKMMRDRVDRESATAELGPVASSPLL